MSAVPVPVELSARPRAAWLRPPAVRFGLALVVFVLLVAFLGPLFAPHTPTQLITRAYAPAGDNGLLLGSDSLGRDVFSRVLYGGRTIIILPFVATLAAYLVGGTIGMLAAVAGGWIGEFAMRALDVILIFPGMLLLLVLLTGFGDSLTAVFLGILLLQVPALARIVYAAAVELSVRGYVEAAAARGERLLYVIFKEILPNMAGTIAADFGPRLISSVFLIAALAFLGLGIEPPTANWALMITENRGGITINGLSVAGPIVMIAALTIGVSLISDGVARSLGSNEGGGE